MIAPRRMSKLSTCGILCIVLLAAAFGARAQETVPNPYPTRLDLLSDSEIGAFIRRINQENLALQSKIELTTRLCLGIPCQTRDMGERAGGTAAKEPLWNFKRVDPISFVEQSYALCLAQDWPDFIDNLKRMRYRKGEVGFANRNHFLVPDWLKANRWLFHDVSAKLAGENTFPIARFIARKEFYEQAGEIRLAAEVKNTTAVVETIPCRIVNALLEGLQTGDLAVCLSNESSDKDDIVGIIVFTSEGAMIRYASLLSKTVIERPLVQFLEDNPKFAGVLVVRLHARADMISRPVPFTLDLGPKRAQENHTDQSKEP